MKSSEKVRALWSMLAFRPGEAILVGSGPMALRDMRDVGDLDVFTTTKQWFDKMQYGDTFGFSEPKWDLVLPNNRSVRHRNDPALLSRCFEAGGQQIEVNLFSAWRYRAEEGGNKLDLSGLIARAEDVDGVPCMPLAELIAWKLEAGRDKDMLDIAQIAAYLTQEHAERNPE